MSVSGGSVTEATISSLRSSTTYSIQVAAVNSAGIGVYSGSLIVQTTSKCTDSIYPHTQHVISTNMYVYRCVVFLAMCILL